MMYELTQMDARKTGRAEGRAEGVDLMAKLASLLVRDRRYDDIVRAENDAAFRAEKMKEYGLE